MIASNLTEMCFHISSN